MLFFILFLSFCLRVICKGLRKNSEIFVNLRKSSGQSMRERLTADQNFWCSRVFLAVLRVFRGIMGCSGVLWDVPGVFRGCSGLFRWCSGGVPGCSGGVPGVFRGVPGCSGVFRGVPGVFRVLQTPNHGHAGSRRCKQRRSQLNGEFVAQIKLFISGRAKKNATGGPENLRL